MGLTVRVGALSACLGFVFIALAGWIGGGCAPWQKDSPATTKASSTTTKASTKPVDETVTIDLNERWIDFAPRASGVLRPKAPGLPPAKLPEDLLAALGKMTEGRQSAQTPVLVTLGDYVKFDGAFPGEKGKWTKWDQGVLDAVAKLRAENRPMIVEIWKEPDRPPFKERVDFLSAWVHTVKLLRGPDSPWPDIVLMGPSLSKEDGGRIQEFLKVSKEWNVFPAIVGWHEDGLKHDISGHIGGQMNNFWQDGFGLDQIAVSANAGIDAKYMASDPAIFLGQMEWSFKNNGWQPIAQTFQFKLTHLFTPENKPRSVYYTYKAYADLAAPGRKSVKVADSQTVAGVAVWDLSKRSGRALLGRNRSRVDAKHVLGNVDVLLKGANGAEAVVRVSRIADSGAKPSDGPTAAVERVYPVKNGEVRVPLPLAKFASGDAYAIEFTVRGTPPPPPATTKSTTTVTTTTRAATRP